MFKPNTKRQNDFCASLGSFLLPTKTLQVSKIGTTVTQPNLTPVIPLKIFNWRELRTIKPVKYSKYHTNDAKSRIFISVIVPLNKTCI